MTRRPFRVHSLGNLGLDYPSIISGLLRSEKVATGRSKNGEIKRSGSLVVYGEPGTRKLVDLQLAPDSPDETWQLVGNTAEPQIVPS